MAEVRQQSLQNVKLLKNMLVAHATGSPVVDNYWDIRAKCLKDPAVSARLPDFVHTCRTLGEFWAMIKSEFSTYRERRDYLNKQFEPLLKYLEQSNQTPADVVTDDALARVSTTCISERWQRALDRRATDPAGAITMARTLLEDVCKHILNESNVNYDDMAPLPKLYKLVADTLDWAPAKHLDPIFNQVLSGCHSVVQGLGALRSKLGDAHAPGKSFVRPASRHAELAVNLAGAMAAFLLATLEARDSR